jgi:DNA-binding beta-propeller fold protein YncE
MPRTPKVHLAAGTIATTTWPYFPGSILPVRVYGFPAPYQAELLGPGRLLPGGSYEIPERVASGSAWLVAGNATGLAATHLRIASPPPAHRPMFVVASYDDGLIFHAPSDVAADQTGRIAATDTQGSALTLATLAPWSVARIDGVAFGDELAIDRTTRAIFVTNRDWNGSGALTRIAPDGGVTRVATGATAEGLAIDERRQIVYVANANDGTIACVDARSMRVIRRFPAASRIFSLALSADGTRLYGVSNESASSPFGAPGAVVAIAVSGAEAKVVARSGDLVFPLGIALDARTQTLFVTDEALGQVYVLDAATLAPRRAPLRTCMTPWKPSLDAASERLYVPCAGADAIDAFDARTLRRISRAPFATGSYPLAVAILHPT